MTEHLAKTPVRSDVQAVIFDWAARSRPGTPPTCGRSGRPSPGWAPSRARATAWPRLCTTAEEQVRRRGRTDGSSARLEDVLTAAGLDPQDEATAAGLAAYREFWEPHTFTHPHIPEVWGG